MNDKLKPAIFQVKTDERLVAFAERHRMPGFYFDTNGMYCLCLGRYLLTVFVNDMTGNVEVAVDSISSEGMYDMNVEWETPANEQELYDTVCRFVSKYGGKCER